MRYFIELSRVAESYEALIYSDNRVLGRQRPGLALGPQATVSIKGRSSTLGELVELLVDPRRRQWAERFDQRGQLELGHYLYHQLFAETRPA